MKNISLHIKRDDDSCDNDCVFLSGCYVSRTGSCLLFMDVLRPELYYGDISSWKPCKSCNTVYNRVASPDGEEQ
jgi:hypothetical protein